MVKEGKTINIDTTRSGSNVKVDVGRGNKISGTGSAGEAKVIVETSKKSKTKAKEYIGITDSKNVEITERNVRIVDAADSDFTFDESDEVGIANSNDCSFTFFEPTLIALKNCRHCKVEIYTTDPSTVELIQVDNTKVEVVYINSKTNQIFDFTAPRGPQPQSETQPNRGPQPVGAALVDKTDDTTTHVTLSHTGKVTDGGVVFVGDNTTIKDGKIVGKRKPR